MASASTRSAAVALVPSLPTIEALEGFASRPVRRRRRILWYQPHPVVRAMLRHPIERLGQWDGGRFVPVRPGSITAETVHVMSHGWAPGLGPVLRAYPEFVRVWDGQAKTADGGRFDDWYGPLADAILDRDQDAAVLGFSWIDMSATQLGLLRGAQSQASTGAAAQALALGLRTALSPSPHRIHLTGFSHGCKVAAVAGLLLDDPPEHLTLLDSPEGLLPVIGGALNDLSPYLRLYDIGHGAGQTFVDSYPSEYGVHYGVRAGLGSVVEVELDPARCPIPDSTSAHGYAHAWYLESGDHGVGLAWSPLLAGSAPAATQLHQTADVDAWRLAANPTVAPAPSIASAVLRVVEKRGAPIVLTTEARRTYRAVRWQRPGDVAATARVRWLSGPPDAQVSLTSRRRERWRSQKGWSTDPVRKAVIPLGGLRPGPILNRLELKSSAPAEVEIQRAATSGISLPLLSHARRWIRPAAMALTLPMTAFVGANAWRLARRITTYADTARRPASQPRKD